MMSRIWRTVIAGTAAALSLLSIASAQPGATPQGTPAPQNTPAPPAQGSQETQPAPPSQGTAQSPVGEGELILATQIAEQWLALIDQGKFADTWTHTSRYFQTNMPQDKWVQTLTAAQQQLGKASDRKLTGREARTDIPGAPAGQYILVGYATDFERKPGLLETVTFIREDDAWKVVGYSATPKPAEGAQGAQGQNPPAAAAETPQPASTPPPSR
jgi:serine/threonine-protein kinase